MNFKFIEGRKTSNKVVEFRGVGVVYKEVVHNKGEGGGVGVVSEQHGGYKFMTVGTGIPELMFCRVAKQKMPWASPTERQSIT